MLFLHPGRITFGGSPLDSVAAVAIDRTPAPSAGGPSPIIEHGDPGPHPVFADVPRQTTTITVRQALSADSRLDLAPGAMAILELLIAPAAADSSRRRLAAAAVLLSCTTDLRTDQAGRPAALRTLTFTALSPDGIADPITISEAPD